MTNEENRNIYYLNELSDYKVDSDYPDIRDWKVEDSMGRVIGEVENLIVNKHAKRVVYVDIELNDDFLEGASQYNKVTSNHAESHAFINEDGDRHVIIPVGLVDVDENKKCVRTSQIETRLIARARRKGKNAVIDSQYERDSYNHYTKNEKFSDNINTDSKFYERPEFNSSVFRAP